MSELTLTPDPPRDDRVARFALSLFSCAKSPGMCVPFGTFKRATPMRYLSSELFEKKKRGHRKSKTRRMRARAAEDRLLRSGRCDQSGGEAEEDRRDGVG